MSKLFVYAPNPHNGTFWIDHYCIEKISADILIQKLKLSLFVHKIVKDIEEFWGRNVILKWGYLPHLLVKALQNSKPKAQWGEVLMWTFSWFLLVFLNINEFSIMETSSFNLFQFNDYFLIVNNRLFILYYVRKWCVNFDI